MIGIIMTTTVSLIKKSLIAMRNYNIGSEAANGDLFCANALPLYLSIFTDIFCHFLRGIYNVIENKKIQNK